MSTRSDWYDHAELYDFLYDGDSEREANFLLRMALEHGRAVQRVLEPACGSGRLLRALARRGHEVSGFDRNAASLRYARARLREEGLRATLTQQDLAAFRCPTRFDLAHCLLSSFKYLQREADATSHLRCLARVLRPGGIYVLGLHLTDPQAQGEARERWRRSHGGLHVEVELRTEQPDLQRRRERVELKLQARRKGETISAHEHWWWRTWTDAQLERLLRRVPEWELVACHDFDFRLRQLADLRLDKILILRRSFSAVCQLRIDQR